MLDFFHTLIFQKSCSHSRSTESKEQLYALCVDISLPIISTLFTMKIHSVPPKADPSNDYDRTNMYKFYNKGKRLYKKGHDCEESHDSSKVQSI